MTTISFVNFKGGVGKTALAVNFAAYCGQIRGMKTLLIDLDPQSNASLSTMSVEKWQEHERTNGTVAHLFREAAHVTAVGGINATFESVRVFNVFRNVDLLPADPSLFGIDMDLGAAVARETLLKRQIATGLAGYDVIVCDCPPNFTLPTQNALSLSNYYVIPVSPDFLSAVGIALLKRRVAQFASDAQLNIQLNGIAITRIGRPAAFREESIQDIRGQFAQEVLDSQITERASVGDSARRQVSIFDMGNLDASTEFKNMSAEILSRMGV